MEVISSYSDTTGLDQFSLLSHPDRTLESHLFGCDEASKLQLSFKHVNSESFFDVGLLEEMRHLLVYFHDFGKGTDYFAYKIISAIQKELKEPKEGNKHWEKIKKFASDNQSYLDYFDRTKKIEAIPNLSKDPRLGDHSKQGAYFVLTATQHEDMMLRFIMLKVILKHHGNLSNFWIDKAENNQILLDEDGVIFLEKQFARHDFDLYQKIMSKQGLHVKKDDWLPIKKIVTDCDRIDEERYKFEKKKDVRYFFLQHILFSLLLSADKGDVKLPFDIPKSEFIKENNLLPIWLIQKYKEQKFTGIASNIDNQREEAYQLVSENCIKHAAQSFFSITLPTGMGKTFAAYNVAVILQNEYSKQTGGKRPRIVYCLPFTSIIDQNAAILDDILRLAQKIDPSLKKDWLSKNHYLSNHNEQYDGRELAEQEPEYLADGWEHEVIVTTFVQFLESVFTNKNSALRKFHNMTNAIFILDEVQNIPPKYYEAIELVFKKMAEYFNTKFVFVTATQPFLFKNKADIFELTSGKTETYFRQLDRIVIDQSLLRSSDYKKMDVQVFYDLLVNDVRQNGEKSFLIICNTIAQSRWFYSTLQLEFPDDELIYLSSSLLPPVRRWNIKRIKSSNRRKIVVSTQVVEAGVDIDLDVVYRDFAPIDSINQSAGRCNRNAKRGTGKVKLFNLGKHKHIYDAVLMDITEKVLKSFDTNEILEGQLFDLNNQYADAVRKKVTDDSTVSDELIRAMQLLQLETIQDKFELIKEDNLNYNVFMPCSKMARKAWKEYLEILEIQDPYSRKTELKKHKPIMLQYTTRFPKNKYTPIDPKQFLIYESEWKKWYDLKTGFRIDAIEDTTITY